MQEISLGGVAGGPHAALIRDLAERCAAEPAILAAWVGGSLASGTGDDYSDVDFRVAVAPGTVDAWNAPDWGRLLPLPPVGITVLRFGSGTILHHMVLSDGVILDFLVLESTGELREPNVLVLACDDPVLRARIEGFATPAASLVKEVDAAALRTLFVDYWIATHKEMKALARRLDESSFAGLYIECMSLLRALFIEATGKDIEARMSLHMLGALHKGLEGKLTPAQQELLGMPSRTTTETVAAIDAIRTEMARVGHLLAEQYNFDYPIALEEVVQQTWRVRKQELAAR